MEADIALGEQLLHYGELASPPRIQADRAALELLERRDAPPQPIIEHAAELERREQCRTITQCPLEARARNAFPRRDVVVREDRRSTGTTQPRRVVGLEQDVDRILGTVNVLPQ